ncbi:MAG TPA: hypothetical protein VIL74_13100 [Pyrinomonadaceae bacterium]
MVHNEQNKNVETEELPDEWWHRVYLAVMIMTVLVIAALWGFTRYFS